MVCLDTNAVIGILKRSPVSLVEQFDRSMAIGQTAISVIVLFELLFGIAKSSLQRRNRERLAHFLDSPLQILQFDAYDAKEAGDIRAALARSGTSIGAYDVLIAAQARRRNAVLVTANLSEFERVPGLRTENWSA